METLALWASCQIRKSVGCACAGNVENVFPATDFKGNHKLAIPACITARASHTCRDACRDRQPAMAGENVPGIPGTCATRSFTYLARGPCRGIQQSPMVSLYKGLEMKSFPTFVDFSPNKLLNKRSNYR